MQPYSFLAAGHSQNFRKILNCARFIIFTKNHFSHFGSLLLIHGVVRVLEQEVLWGRLLAMQGHPVGAEA